MSGPLEGIKVVEIGVAMAGPFCAMLLGDYGAEVVKIEKVGSGDDSRAWPPFFFDNMGYYFASANRNKRSIALNLKSPDGVKLAGELIGQADVLVHNYRVGVLDRLGLDWETLSRQNPRLVYCGISGFGTSGELAQEPANDLFTQAFTGGMSITGYPDGPPAKMGISVADIGAGMFAAMGVMMALHRRTETGRGQRVDTSLLEGQVSMLAHFLTRYFASGEIPGPSGSGALSSPTYRAYEALDGWVVICAFNERMWQGLVRALGDSRLSDDALYGTAERRVMRRDELIELIGETISKQTQSYWLDALKREGVPSSAVQRIDQVTTHPQVHACKMIQSVILDGLGPINIAGLPIKLSETPGAIRLPPPRLGEHTDELLRGLGHSQQQIQQWCEAGTVGLDKGWNKHSGV